MATKQPIEPLLDVVQVQRIGLEVLANFQKLDQVAYVRFASVYKDFQEIGDFERLLATAGRTGAGLCCGLGGDHEYRSR